METDENSTCYSNFQNTLITEPQPTTIGGWINLLAEQIQKAEVCLENGSQEPYLEAEYLICYAFSIGFNEIDKMVDQPAPRSAANLMAHIFDKRIKERLPAAYITQEAFFAGYSFFVDPRVLIPRSRIENIFDDEEGFDGLLDCDGVARILDLCTGSGCLAVTLAKTFPQAMVDASDISAKALEVAAINRAKFALEKQITLIESDLFQALTGRKYELIVSNPPYVAKATMDGLPPEYRHEPALALAAGEQGLDTVLPLLQQAADHLTPGGLLVCEVGDETQEIMEQCWPEFPGQWLMFHFGGSGLFVINREQLLAWNSLY
ncbi:MAG: 50S ribosomal protein L3 N(5)-glutamine methyltransferase [Magnetococcales bacterium]|nr:50S ribosomal protein L3 N(5)-glutamine methyltransferase [Magnetococcales bacterium]